MTESRGEDSASKPSGQFQSLLRRFIDVTPPELPALGWCWLYIFSVLASYYISGRSVTRWAWPAG